jgi:predicted enzyme related to lactoylglutathione lyase
MAETKTFKPGMFCWADLSTTDQTGATRFYTELFGWKTEDLPMGGGANYTMASVAGNQAAGIGPQKAEEKGMPSRWNVYFGVANVDEATKKAASLGGKVAAEPFDVMDAGRMSVIQDPSGAAFELWQTKRSEAAIPNGQGALAWAELETSNVDACGSFYSKLFNWAPQTQSMGDMQYTVFKTGDEPRAGMMAMAKGTPPNTPSHWTTYFLVDNCDATAKKAKASGGKVLVEPQDIPNTGRFALMFDPQGALFGVLQPLPMTGTK